MKYLIVCGGEIDGDFAERLIMSSGFEVIIAADRGMDFLYEHKITPDIIVGDFDSSSRHLLPFWQVDIYCLRMCREWERLRLQ